MRRRRFRHAVGVPTTRELGRFLRSRRERLTPAEVGLPDSGRRRTPGLRREEVATLAGISVDYLIRLEQGRDTNPSGAVLAAVANVLQLDDDERIHLKQLAAMTQAPELCSLSTPPVSDVAPTVRELLARLAPTPAFVVAPVNDVLAWNPPWARVAAGIGLLDGQPPNLARFVFLHPAARRAYPDWERAADDQVSQLRQAFTRYGHHERAADLLAELVDVPEFAVRWSTHEVSAKHRGAKRIVHPTAGELRFDFEVLVLPDDGDMRLITWLPSDEATDERMRSLLVADDDSRQPRLRLVGER